MQINLDLRMLAPGESTFVPTLRTQLLLWAAKAQAEALGVPVSYRVTVVDSKYGILFTRNTKGRVGITNEDRRES